MQLEHVNKKDINEILNNNKIEKNNNNEINKDNNHDLSQKIEIMPNQMENKENLKNNENNFKSFFLRR